MSVETLSKNRTETEVVSEISIRPADTGSNHLISRIVGGTKSLIQPGKPVFGGHPGIFPFRIAEKKCSLAPGFSFVRRFTSSLT